MRFGRSARDSFVLLCRDPRPLRAHEAADRTRMGYARRGEATVSDHDLTLESPRLHKPGITVQITPLLEMPGAAAVVSGEEGTHLFYPPHENVLPVQVSATPLSPQEDPQATVRKITRIRQTWRADVAAGKAQADSDPFPLAPIVRVYDPAVGTLDLRTLLLCANLPTATELRRFLLAGLPLPEAIATSA